LYFIKLKRSWIMSFSEIREIEWAISDPEEVQKLHELREQNKST